MSTRTWAEICSEDPDSQALLDAINAGGHAAETLMTALRVACRPGGVLYDDERGYLNPAVVLGLATLVSEDPVQWRAVHRYVPPVEPDHQAVVIARKLAESDPWTSGEWGSWCVHCKAMKQYGTEYKDTTALHNVDCLWLQAHKAVEQ